MNTNSVPSAAAGKSGMRGSARSAIPACRRWPIPARSTCAASCARSTGASGCCSRPWAPAWARPCFGSSHADALLRRRRADRRRDPPVQHRPGRRKGAGRHQRQRQGQHRGRGSRIARPGEPGSSSDLGLDHDPEFAVKASGRQTASPALRPRRTRWRGMPGAEPLDGASPRPLEQRPLLPRRRLGRRRQRRRADAQRMRARGAGQRPARARSAQAPRSRRPARSSSSSASRSSPRRARG